MAQSSLEDGLPVAGAHPTVTSRLRSPVWLLLLLGAGVFFGTLDQTVVVTVLSDVIKDIHLPINTRFGEASWIVNGYLLGYTVAMPVMGRLADIFGRTRIFLLCLGIFIVGSVLVAVSPNLPTIVAARAFQAIGGGGLLPVALAMAADAAPAGKRTLVLGSLAAANNGSTFLGPVWGAAVAGLWSWRAIFWLNLPLVIPIAVAMPLLVREHGRGRRAKMDWPGAVLLVLGLSAITFALTDDGANPRPLAVSLAIGLAGCVALAVFAMIEWRSPSPMIDLRVLRQRRVAGAMLVYFLIGGALITALVTVPLMSDVLYGESTRQGGLNLMRLLLLLPIGGVAGGWLAMRTGNMRTIVLGLAVACAGFIWMRLFPFHPGDNGAVAPSTWHLWGALGLIGFGLGLCDGPIVGSVVDAVPAGHRATASALLLVVWTTGMIVGLALLATRGLGAFTSRIADVPLSDPNYTARFQGVLHRTFDETFVAAAVVLAVAMAAAWTLRGSRTHELIVSPYEGLGE